MPATSSGNGSGAAVQAPPGFLPASALSDLVTALQAQGYTVIAPVQHDGVVRLRPIQQADEITRGVRDQQTAGRYRLEEGETDLHFEHAVGPSSAKSFFFPPQQPLYRIQVGADGFEAQDLRPPAPRLAIIGVRPCDLAAIRIQDRVFGEATGPDDPESRYRQTRRQSFLVVVQCTRPGGTCFCVSTNTGPEARDGFDLALTELKGGFVIQAGSDAGRDLLKALPVREVSPAELELAALKIQRARELIGPELDLDEARAALEKNVDHPHWEDVARRCLSCGNCTMVCPTCFCNTVVDGNDLSDGSMTRERHWESCFTHQFSYAGGGPHRSSVLGRYRHWIRHKLCTWWEQFDSAGCVGCGRCITWCPAGIDIRREVEAVMEGGDRKVAAQVTAAPAVSMHGKDRR